MGLANRGCLALIIFVFAVALFLVGVQAFGWFGSPAPTPTPLPSFAAVATPYPSISSATPRPTSPPIPTPVPAAQMDATLTGGSGPAAHVTGPVIGGCPLTVTAPDFAGNDIKNGFLVAIHIAGYKGPATYPVSSGAGRTTIALSASSSGFLATYQSTTGTLTVSARGDVSFDTDLLRPGVAAHLHLSGSITCP